MILRYNAKMNTDIYVAQSSFGGSGVFARKAISKGQLIEMCPVIVIPSDQRAQLQQPPLSRYLLDWENNQGAIALGFGSLYKQSTTPNAYLINNSPVERIQIYALNNISQDDEITLCYDHDGKNHPPA